MSHIKTAEDYGVEAALRELGYETLDDVEKQAKELGLIEEIPPTESDS